MEQLTQRSERDILEAQIRECYGRVVYTHKTHEKMADICNRKHSKIKGWQIMLSAITTSGAIGAVFSTEYALNIITAAVSLLTLLLSGYSKDIDPGALAQKHREAASNMWNVRESYLSLLTDIRDDAIALDALRERRDALQTELHIIYQAAPHTNGTAYKRAQDALQNKEDLTFSDQEIDQFLPKHLRKTTNI